AGLGVTQIPASETTAAVAKGRKAVPVTQVPFAMVCGNESYGNPTGPEIWYHSAAVPDTIGGFTVWGTWDATIGKTPVQVHPAVNLLFDKGLSFGDSWVYGSLEAPRKESGIFTNSGYDRSLAFKNDRVEGWLYGLQVPVLGANVVDGGYWNNASDFS